MTTRRVVVVNHWHDDNRGDSAITQSILGLLAHAEPDADVVLTGLTEPGPGWERSVRLVTRAFPDVQVLPSPVPTELRGRLGRQRGLRTTLTDAAVWIWRLLPVLLGVLTGRPSASLRAQVADADVVVLVGGSNLYDDPSVSPVLSMARLLAVGAPAHAAVRSGARVVLLGHTLGPFPRRAGRLLARRLLAGADLAVVREPGSVAHAERLGVRAVEVAPDMAFATVPRRTALVHSVLGGLPRDPARCLGVSIRRHPSLGGTADARAVEVVAQAARHLVAAGTVDAIVLVPHTVGPTPVEDDRGMTAALREALGDDVPVSVVTDEMTPGELAAFYGALAAVVAVRLHAAILAITGGTPPYAIAYFTAKTEGVMAGVGLADAVGDYATVTVDDIVGGLARILSPDTRARLADGSRHRREELTDRATRWFGMARTRPAAAEQ